MIALPLLLAIVIKGMPLPPMTKAAQSEITADLKSNTDAKIIASHSGLARRTGRVLRIGDLSFVDEGECDGSGCERYRMDAVWPGGIVGVSLKTDENSDYYLVDRESTSLGARPIASPSGLLLFVAFLDEMTGKSAEGVQSSIAIWRLDQPGVGIARVRTVDVPIAAFTKFVSWHSDHCVEFRGLQGYGKINKERTFWLLEQPLDWTLYDSKPIGCN